MTNRIFYKTKIVVTVLSEEPIGFNYTLADIENAIDEGEMSGDWNITESCELDGAKVVQELIRMGDQPEFFSLDKNGNDIIEEGDRVEVTNEDGNVWEGIVLEIKQDTDGSTYASVEDEEGDVYDVDINSLALYE